MDTGIYIGVIVVLLLALGRQALAFRESNRSCRALQLAHTELDDRHRQTVEQNAELERLNNELRAMRAEIMNDNRELLESRALWEQLATTDPMTEIANHRAFQSRLREEVARAQRYGYPFVLLMLDVDQFKPYNDAYGHPAGDQVLREVARLMRETVREGDLVARYGGEEFAALLPQTDSEAGRRVAERIREVVGAYNFLHRDVTLSIGAAVFRPEGLGVEALIQSADRALYAAKNGGRNRVIFAKDIEEARHY